MLSTCVESTFANGRRCCSVCITVMTGPVACGVVAVVECQETLAHAVLLASPVQKAHVRHKGGA